MKALALSLALIALASGCSLFDDDDYIPRRPRHFPDGTPFVVGILEATPDTAAFYGPPEVFVGTITDSMNGAFAPEQDPAFLVDNAIWSPTLYGQVVKLANQARFLPVPDNGATVSITGPLGQGGERTVSLQLKNHGVYADLAGQLEIFPAATYRLNVTRSDGRRYTATSSVPSLPVWSISDTTYVPARLRLHATGYTELGQALLPEWNSPDDSTVTVFQANYSHDPYLWGVSDEQFLHWQRGPHRREGSHYSIHIRSYEPRYQPGAMWGIGCDMEFIQSVVAWHRLSFMSPELSIYYINEFDHYSLVSDRGFEQTARRLWGSEGFGPAYAEWLFSRGNIESLDGGLRPFGVFGGYSSIYRTTVMVPVRSYPMPADWSCRRPPPP